MHLIHRFTSLLVPALLSLHSCVFALSINRSLHDSHPQEKAIIQERSPDSNNSSSLGADIAECSSPWCYRFYNSKTAPHFVKSWPGVDFDTGEFYSGSVAIDENDPSRTLFFVFKPKHGIPKDSPNEEGVTIWLNGGPGASSFLGFLQENGPFLWQPGTQAPSKNQFAWSKMTNMLWVEQPVGTGFSQGEIRAKNEFDVAKDFLGFFKNWQKLFGIENYKIYLTGESYAGKYIPYIGSAMLDQKDKKHFDISGALMYNPSIGDNGNVQMFYPINQFAHNNNEILGLDPSTLQKMEDISSDPKCGYTDYMDRYLQFPPPNQQPDVSHLPLHGCNAYSLFFQTYDKNPCFNQYHITDYCPLLYDPLGYGQANPGNPYFNHTNVKAAIHAPMNVSWEVATDRQPFVKNDYSANSIQSVLPHVIEGTNRVMVASGDWDMVLPTDGTMMSIQNMTWAGQLGFQEAPSKHFVVPITAYPETPTEGPAYPDQGIMGKQHFERGLMWVEVYQAGHMVPQYQPAAAWRHLEWVLGRIDEL